MSNALVPYKFKAGKTISPRHVNENARAMWRQAKMLESIRYNDFALHFDVPNYANGDSGSDAEIQLVTGFPFELTGIELIAYGDSDGTPASGSDTLTLSCTSNTSIDSVSVSVSHGPTAGLSQSRAFVSVSESIGAPGEKFSITAPATAGAEVMIQAVFYGRYDMHSETPVSIPDPPSVASGEVHSVTEWNTWFSDMASAASSLGNAMIGRKFAVVASLARNANPSVTYTPPDDDCYSIIPAGKFKSTVSGNWQLGSDNNVFCSLTLVDGATENVYVSSQDVGIGFGGIGELKMSPMSFAGNGYAFGSLESSYFRIDHVNQSAPQDIARLLAIVVFEG